MPSRPPQVIVEFSGGLELLFANQRKLTIPLPASHETEPTKITWLINQLVAKMEDKRTELFVVDGSVRPGILVLINEADWELEGEEDYELQDGDVVLFVSTLHGG